ncbi:MAG: DUF4435 domain-containing protein [Bacteroidaceae bacterium]|nr:DUF4435 domain-containing protein [Bacteroidaceae bacterium]
MPSLRDNINSEYIAAANRMRSRQARRRIVAYVESYDDIFFWRTVLSRFENEQLYFEVMLPSRYNLSKGKKPVLMNLIGNKVGHDMIACVDADYDYLLQGRTKLSADIINNPYILHTYVYAIENYQCYAPSLHNVCVMVTLNDRQVFDFQRFMRTYSQAIYPLFVWNIWHYRYGCYSDFTMSDFNRVIETGNINIGRPAQAIDNVQRKVQRKVSALKHMHPDAVPQVEQLAQELTQLGITPDTTYLYIQGHHLYDKVVTPLLKKVCSRLRQQRENEIHHNAQHGTQLRNELASYSHSVGDINTMLRRNTEYQTALPFLQLLKDVERIIGN